MVPGKTYTLRAKTVEEAKVFKETLERTFVDWQNRGKAPPTRWEKLNDRARKLAHSPRLQFSVFGLIVVNFLVNCLNFELLPEPGSLDQAIFDWIDFVFTVLFTFDLVLNLWVTGLLAFLKSIFNLIDLMVVLLSWAAFLSPDLNNLSVLRLFRVARIIRLARRLKSLITLARSLSGAFLPMANTFGPLAPPLFACLSFLPHLLAAALPPSVPGQSRAHTVRRQEGMGAGGWPSGPASRMEPRACLLSLMLMRARGCRQG